MLVTHAGELVPAYTETHRRKNKYSVEFYKNGMVKAIALEEIQDIQTPIGEFPAERVTFFETGELKRFFPLDGKISGLWTEEEEKKLAIPLSFDLPFASFAAIIGGIAFYLSGNIRSVTLFPGETVQVSTGYGVIPARNGFSLYDGSGNLESLEPAGPAAVKTPIGTLTAFDPNAIGVNADVNSLIFDDSGRILSLITVNDRITARTEDGRTAEFIPREAVNPLDGETTITEGLRIAFDYGANTVTLNSAELPDGPAEAAFPLSGTAFEIAARPGSPFYGACSPSACASCAHGCGHK
jgi:hypothetical protein